MPEIILWLSASFSCANKLLKGVPRPQLLSSARSAGPSGRFGGTSAPQRTHRSTSKARRGGPEGQLALGHSHPDFDLPKCPSTRLDLFTAGRGVSGSPKTRSSP